MASPEVLLPAILLGIALAVGPALAVAVYSAGRHRALWSAFLWGWAGWFIALVVRILPVQIPQVFFISQIQTDVAVALVFGLYAAAMAGLFEEGFRFYLLRRSTSRRSSGRAVLSFGLGWGLGEAFILFVPALAILPILPGASLTAQDVLPGAVERNLAILAHVAFTYVVLHAITRGKGLLVLAMALHFALNAVVVSTLLFTGDVWLTELVLAGMVVVILGIATWVSRGWSVPPVETPDVPAAVAPPPGR